MAVTAEEFRALALDLPEVSEGAHMDHPDFRVRGKIFASLGPGEAWGMVKLTPEQQAECLRDHPRAFEPASGAWGRRGATIVRLESARATVVRSLIRLAWRNTAPARLVRSFDEDAS